MIQIVIEFDFVITIWINQLAAALTLNFHTETTLHYDMTPYTVKYQEFDSP